LKELVARKSHVHEKYLTQDSYRKGLLGEERPPLGKGSVEEKHCKDTLLEVPVGNF
jgi:hypothetical protein